MTEIKSLHPQIRAVLDNINKSGISPWNTLPLSEARAIYLDQCGAAAGEMIPLGHCHIN